MGHQPLANDERGLAFEVPDGAKAWRVQRVTGKRGRQEALYDDGVPLALSIDGSVPELRAALEHADELITGGYRLIPVDRNGAQVGDQVAFIRLRGDDDDEPRNAQPAPQSVEGLALAEGFKQVVTAFVQREGDREKTHRNATEQLYSDVRPVGGVDDLVEEPPPSPPPQPEPDMLARLLQAAPQILQLLELFKGQGEAPNGTNGAQQRNGAGGAPFDLKPEGEG